MVGNCLHTLHTLHGTSAVVSTGGADAQKRRFAVAHGTIRIRAFLSLSSTQNLAFPINSTNLLSDCSMVMPKVPNNHRKELARHLAAYKEIVNRLHFNFFADPNSFALAIWCALGL